MAKLPITAFLVVSELVAAVMPLSATADPYLLSGKPCTSKDGICTSFFDGSPINVIDDFTISAKKKGSAAITVSGMMQCEYFGSASGTTNGVVDLGAQIVKKGSEIDLTGPGASHIAARIPAAVNFGTNSLAINLSTTRVFSINQGRNEFQYKMSKLRMDPSTQCIIFNITFTALVLD